jgi:hypothetical protein
VIRLFQRPLSPPERAENQRNASSRRLRHPCRFCGILDKDWEFGYFAAAYAVRLRVRRLRALFNSASSCLLSVSQSVMYVIGSRGSIRSADIRSIRSNDIGSKFADALTPRNEFVVESISFDRWQSERNAGTVSMLIMRLQSLAPDLGPLCSIGGYSFSAPLLAGQARSRRLFFPVRAHIDVSASRLAQKSRRR